MILSVCVYVNDPISMCVKQLTSEQAPMAGKEIWWKVLPLPKLLVFVVTMLEENHREHFPFQALGSTRQWQ